MFLREKIRLNFCSQNIQIIEKKLRFSIFYERSNYCFMFFLRNRREAPKFLEILSKQQGIFMKICFLSEYYSPKYGGQYASVKGTVDICRLNKLDYVIIHKNIYPLTLPLFKSNIHFQNKFN